MAQHATASEPTDVSNTTTWYGLGKIGWGIWALMAVGNSAVVLSEDPNLTGVGGVVAIALIAYLWIRFLKFLIQKLGGL